MEIKSVSKIYKEALLYKLRKTKLVGFNEFEIYKDADLSIETIDPEVLVPAQRYVLRSNIVRTEQLSLAFRFKGVDIFNLSCGLLFRTEVMTMDEMPIPLLPPIVEMSIETDGKVVPLISDGMHRVFTARTLSPKEITVIMVKKVPVKFPYYAHALSGWKDVNVIDQLTPEYKRKSYRHPEDYKALFRNYNGVFEGVQVKRDNV